VQSAIGLMVIGAIVAASNDLQFDVQFIFILFNDTFLFIIIIISFRKKCIKIVILVKRICLYDDEQFIYSIQWSY